MTDKLIRLGSRGSELALWQTNRVTALLEQAWPEHSFEVEIFSTRGDQIIDQPLPQIGGKGLFTAELESALREGRIDFAVHSLKDLPTEDAEGITIGAIPQRASVADVLVSRAGHTLETLPQRASVGTSSTRRAAQLLAQRSDLNLIDLRGNVPTRIRKAQEPDGPYDAVMLAHAGLERLGLLDAVSEILSPEVMLPAPGQGALGVQCRDEAESLDLLRPIDTNLARVATTAERAFLNALGGGCALPIAAYALQSDDGRWRLRGRVLSVDGRSVIDVECRWDQAEDAAQVGADLAQEALAAGADELLQGL